MLRSRDREAASSRLEVARRRLLEDSTRPVRGVIDMSSGVVISLDELGIRLEVAANLDHGLGPVTTSAISTGLDTRSKRGGASQNRASKGGGEEGDGELHVGRRG